jgi:hypothetical protein
VPTALDQHIAVVNVRPGDALVMIAIGAVSALGAIAVFRRRDLLGA